MSAKQETFKYFDGLKPGAKFYSIDLANYINNRVDRHHFVSTYIRYLREYRQERGRRIANIDKQKSAYEVMA